jgi:hypothetical protein
VEQRGAWFRLVVGSEARRCEVDDRAVAFIDATHRRQIAYDTLDDAVRGMRGYLEGGLTLDELSGQG